LIWRSKIESFSVKSPDVAEVARQFFAQRNGGQKQAACSTSREVRQVKRFAQDIAAGMIEGRREWQRRLTGRLLRADEQIRLL
jgi:hypothetical protein